MFQISAWRASGVGGEDHEVLRGGEGNTIEFSKVAHFAGFLTDLIEKSTLESNHSFDAFCQTRCANLKIDRLIRGPHSKNLLLKLAKI